MINKLYFEEPIWSIGVFYTEKLTDLNKDIKLVLSAKDVTDVNARFVADPFIIKKNSKWYMFFEIYDENKQKGVIGFATSQDGIKWDYKNVILEENYHLSYPYIFEYNNEIYMIPEIAHSGKVRLYKFTEFPQKLEYLKDIIDGSYWDCSLVDYNNKYYLFAHKQNNLYLYYSESLFGDWKSHPNNPIVKDNEKISRPAGRIIKENNDLIRFSQDKSEYYGKCINKIKITMISETEYKEEDQGVVLKGSNIIGSFNKDGMHNIDIARDSDKYIVIVDGHYFKKCNRIISKLKQIITK